MSKDQVKSKKKNKFYSYVWIYKVENICIYLFSAEQREESVSWPPHPRNCMPAGPREMILLASPSPSTSGGGLVSFCGFTRRQVMRVGAAQVRGGMMTRRPLCLLPRIEPPRASTMKLTRNLWLDTGHNSYLLVQIWINMRDFIKCVLVHYCWADPVCMGLATGLTLSDVSVAGLLGISESSSYSFGSGSGVCCCNRQQTQLFTTLFT